MPHAGPAPTENFLSAVSNGMSGILTASVFAAGIYAASIFATSLTAHKAVLP